MPLTAELINSSFVFILRAFDSTRLIVSSIDLMLKISAETPLASLAFVSALLFKPDWKIPAFKRITTL